MLSIVTKILKIIIKISIKAASLSTDYELNVVKLFSFCKK